MQMAANGREAKWLILFLACMATFGGYYSFDFPSVLHNPLRRHFSMDSGSFEFHFSLLYSLYSIPNIVLPGFGGALSDLVGNDKVLIGCATLVLLGNILLLIACVRVDFATLEAGRFVFGLGAETLQVCANTIIAKWFVGQELALALGINLSACKLGGVLTDWASPYIAREYGINAAAGMVTFLCSACFVLTLALARYDSQCSELDLLPSSATMHDEKQRPNYQSISQQDADNPVPREIELAQRTDEQNGGDEQNVEPSSSTTSSVASVFRHFGLSTWLLFAITFIMYGVFVPFNNISNGVLLEVFFPTEDGHGSHSVTEEVSAAQLQSIPYFLSVLITPFLGWAIDRYGYRTAQLVLSALFLFLAHAYIFYSDVGPAYPLILIGLAYSVFGSVSWACVPLLVVPSHHGAAYGVMCAFQNAGQSVVPLFLQMIVRRTGLFRDCEVLLASMAVVALVLSIGLYLLDYNRNKNALQNSTLDG